LLSKSASTKRWLALLLWIAVIFTFSTDSFSSDGTSRGIIPVLRFLFPFLSPAQLEIGHLVCRKAAHVTAYFVLGILAWRAATTLQAPNLRPELLTIAVVLLVAISDEFHQSFVPSRTSAIGDVGFDLAGGIAALLLMLRLRHESRTLHPHSVL
jgi:VanZ family protein